MDDVQRCLSQAAARRAERRAGLLRFVSLLVLGSKPRAWRDRCWFCSELVAAAYRRQGIALATERPAYTSPADLAVSPLLELAFVIKPE